MIADYEDDAHFCLKCHATILGLDNYVNHRKSGCNKALVELPKSPIPSQMLPTEESFGLKADDFFSSLELQSSNKKATMPSSGGKSVSGILTRSKTSAAIQASSSKEAEPSKSGKNAWIGGHQLKELGTGDNQSRLLKAVDNLSRHTYLKKEEPPALQEYNDSEDESEDFEYEDEDFEEDVSAPPRSYTGGKWLPEFPGKWKRLLSPPQSTYAEVPPPNHTKGKWKPASLTEQFPPPNHTKGKWKPKSRKYVSPFRKSSGSVQYWCGPCNRRLASKVVYERHLKSDLHMKRTLQDFDDSSHLSYRKVEPKAATTATSDKKGRTRRKLFVKCEVCRSRVTAQMMGKHLISHYHCRKGDIRKPEAQKLVLDNIHSVVLQSPYQCGPCKYYCNTHDYFLEHWRTTEHKETVDKLPGYILCSFCKFSTPSNETMLTHLTSPEHSEVLSVINRSVPIVIKKINPISCGTCSDTFIFNVQLRKHCQVFGHEYAGTCTDEYQQKQRCKDCDASFKSKLTLQRHMDTAHNTKMYFCSPCNLSFSTPEDIAQHRKTPEHRYANSDKPKTCDYCSATFPSFLQLKAHLKDSHPERSHPCPHCGLKFTVPQDVTVHLRTKSCEYLHNDKPHACDKCPFGTETLSELLFHKALHDGPQASGSKAAQTFKCPLCDRSFVRASLRYHLQNHTDEKAYRCEYCDARFARKNNWKHHVRKHEVEGKPRKRDKSEAEKVFLCATCGANFSKNSTLQNHMTIHTGKKFACTEPDCLHLARNAAELKTHLQIHSDEKNYQCSLCEYRGKTKQQLKRHATIHDNSKKYRCSKCSFTTRLGFHLKRHERVHTGSKPYACPHCEYRCNNLENLRKHVLSTNKHPGKCIYECKFCGTFRTNFAKDFRMHLLASHGDVFESKVEAAGYVAGVYDQKEDEELEDDGLMDPSEGQGQEELFPMYIVAKDEVVCVDKDTWSMVASFDVEESGTLVPFTGDGEPLFQEHFS